MQINVLFCSKAVPIPESFYPCFAKDTVGPFLRNILLSKGIVISMSHHTSAQETRARLTASQRKKKTQNNTHCMAVNVELFGSDILSSNHADRQT